MGSMRSKTKYTPVPPKGGCPVSGPSTAPISVRRAIALDMWWDLYGQRQEWAWTDGPNATDIKNHGGRVVLRPAAG
jgi:hypothetical protein